VLSNTTRAPLNGITELNAARAVGPDNVTDPCITRNAPIPAALLSAPNDQSPVPTFVNPNNAVLNELEIAPSNTESRLSAPKTNVPAVAFEFRNVPAPETDPNARFVYPRMSNRVPAAKSTVVSG
jgi:hypothetical protein